MKVGILPFADQSHASSRIRAHWLAKYWSEAEIYLLDDDDLWYGQRDQYDAVIIQKGFSPKCTEFAKIFKSMGKIVAWDLCDPLWWYYPRLHRLMSKVVDFAVCSTQALTELAECELEIKCYHIFDRHDLEYYNQTKTHEQKDKIVFVWFGYFMNSYIINSFIPNLSRLMADGYKFELHVITEYPEMKIVGEESAVPVVYKKYDHETFVSDMMQADVALLPNIVGPKMKYKSNHKVETAMLCGLPVATGYSYKQLKRFLDHEYRIFVDDQQRGNLMIDSKVSQYELQDYSKLPQYAIQHSVTQWEEYLLIESCRA